MTNLTTSRGGAHATVQDQHDQHTEEILSSSSLSSPISSLSPTTPNSISLAAPPRMSPLPRSVSHTGAPSWSCNTSQEVIAGGRRGSADSSTVSESLVKQIHASPPPLKRSRSNTVSACFKSHNALKAITERARSSTQNSLASLPDTAIPAGLSRKASMSLSLKPGTAFTKMPQEVHQDGKTSLGSSVPLSPKSPRSPLAAWVPHRQCMLSPESEELVNGNSLGPPGARNIASPDSSMPSTPLTPHHIAYIDHINVSYNPHSANGGECKKLLMRLERFKKRSSIDLSPLSAEAAAAVKSASAKSATACAGTSGNNTPRTPSTPSPMSRSSSASGGTTSGGLAAAFENADSPKSAHAQLHGHTFKVTAKVRDQADSNKVEVVYADGHRLHLDVTGLLHTEVLERIGLHAHVMAKRNTAQA